MTHAHYVTQLLASKCSIPVPLTTRRLRLRPFEESDIDGIAALLADPEATRFIGNVRSRAAAAESVRVMRDAFSARGWGTLGVLTHEKPDCIGYCGVRPLPQTSELEIAFALRQDCWNLGYATEAAMASIDAAFNHLSIESIVATVYPENQASRRVLEKLGLTFEREVFGWWPNATALLYRIERQQWHN